jgi:hypothetical protein
MRTWKTYPFAVLMLAAICGCSARPMNLTEGPPDAKGRIARLEKAFQNRGVSRTDKMRLATELVRLGIRDPIYRDYIDREVDRALAAEEKAAASWDASQNGRSDARMRIQETAVNISTKNAFSASRLTGDSTRVSPFNPNRPPDATNLLPMVMRSMTAVEGDSVAREQLRRALTGSNVLLSAEAALGLARLKDQTSIPDIEQAAVRFNQPFLFARALLYFGDPTADEIARNLLHDDNLVSGIQETAKLRKYDPYYRKIR